MKGARKLGELLVLASSLCLTTAGFGLFWSFGAFFKAWGMQWPSSQEFLSKVFMATFPVFALSSVIFGFLSDRRGQRVALSCGAGLIGAGCLILALSDETWMIFLGWALLVSAGLAAGITPSLMALARCFQRYKGLATGVAMSGFGLGTITLAALSEVLITSLGWRRAVLIVGAIAAASCVSAAWAAGMGSQASLEMGLGPPPARTHSLDERGRGGAWDSQEQGVSARGLALRVLKGSSTDPKHLGSGRCTVTDPELAALRRVRDKLSFVIFALSAKAHHNMSFSADEAAGCREVLTQLARELVDMSAVLEKKVSRSVQEEIRTRVEGPP